MQVNRSRGDDVPSASSAQRCGRNAAPAQRGAASDGSGPARGSVA